MGDITERPHEVRIIIRAFPYSVDVDDPFDLGKTVTRERLGRLGDVVYLSERDYERAQRFSAAVAVTEEVGVEEGDDSALPEEIDVEVASVHAVAEYIRDHHLNVDGTILLTEDDDGVYIPDSATKVLAAEQEASGGQHRKGVVEAMQYLVAQENG